MATKTNGNTTKWLGLVITLAVLFATIVGTWVTYGRDIDQNSSDIATLGEGGSIQSETNRFDIALIKKDLTIIQSEQKEMRDEQKEGFKAILERLPK